MTGRIILVRHGQTASNIHRVIDTRPPGAELSELGRTQAAAAGRELAAFCGERLARMYCSVALRAQQTAVLAGAAFEEARGLEPGTLRLDVRQGVQEIYAGDMERIAGSENIASYLAVLHRMLADDAAAAFPNGEDTAAVLGRARPVLEPIAVELEGAERDIAMVSHGGASRVMAAHAAGVDADWAFESRLPNTGFIVLEPDGRPFGQWDMVRWDVAERDVDA